MNKQIQNGTYNRAREPQGVFLLQPSLLTQSPDWFEKPNSPLINTREKKKDYPLTEDNVFFFFSWSSIIDLFKFHTQSCCRWKSTEGWKGQGEKTEYQVIARVIVSLWRR